MALMHRNLRCFRCALVRGMASQGDCSVTGQTRTIVSSNGSDVCGQSDVGSSVQVRQRL